MIFLYANYYFNFDFNVTCITGKQKAVNIAHKSLLKAPSHKWEHLRSSKQSLDELRSYDWEQAVGLGVVLGYNRLRALDIDGCEDLLIINDFLKLLNLPLNYKWTILSGSKKGFHILFYSDNHKFNVLKNKVKTFKSSSDFKMAFKHIELRWIGHLVLPPSVHQSTMNYQFLNGIPLNPPKEIELVSLYELLKMYCSGKSLKESEDDESYASGVYIEEDKKADDESYTSGVYIEEDEETDDESYASGVYIEEDKKADDESYTSGVYIEEDEETDDESYASGVYIEEDEEADDESYTSGVYIEEDEETDDESYASGVYIEEDKEADDESYTSGVYIEEDEETDDESYASGVYIEEDKDYKEPYYLFFDTETTGVPDDWNAPLTLFSNWPRLVQLAYQLYDAEGALILSNESVIKPSGFSIPKDASDVHGITTDYAVNYGNEIKDVLSAFEEQCLKSKYLVAHNINFDSKVMGSEFLRNTSKNPISELKLICTMEASTDFCKIEGYYGYKWPKLSELHIKLFGEDFEDAHNALADIEATARCFWQMRKMKLI